MRGVAVRAVAAVLRGVWRRGQQLAQCEWAQAVQALVWLLAVLVRTHPLRAREVTRAVWAVRVLVPARAQSDGVGCLSMPPLCLCVIGGTKCAVTPLTPPAWPGSSRALQPTRAGPVFRFCAPQILAVSSFQFITCAHKSSVLAICVVNRADTPLRR